MSTTPFMVFSSTYYLELCNALIIYKNIYYNYLCRWDITEHQHFYLSECTSVGQSYSTT